MRRLRNLVDICVPLAGVFLILGALLLGTPRRSQLAVAILGILLVEAGVWKLSHRVLPEERQYHALRAEVMAGGILEQMQQRGELMARFLAEDLRDSIRQQDVKAVPGAVGLAGRPSPLSGSRADHRKTWDALHAIQTPGSPDLLGKVLRTYLDATPSLLTTLRTVLAQDRMERIKNAAEATSSGACFCGSSSWRRPTLPRITRHRPGVALYGCLWHHARNGLRSQPCSCVEADVQPIRL